MEKEQVAYRLSQIFHPAIIEIPGAILALYMFGLPLKEIFYFAVLPISILTAVIYGVLAMPKYRELNMNTKADRDMFYILSILLLTITAVATHHFNGPEIIAGLYPGIIAVGIINYLINSKVKISLHLTGMGVLTAVFTGLSPGYGILFLGFSALVAWSRIKLGRHTPLETFLGFTVSFTVILASLLFTMGSA